MAAEPITVSITRHVAPERAREVAAWARAGQDLLSSYPGYLGSGWIRPDPQSHDWHMLFRFADAASLAAWQASPERAWWVASALGMVEHSPEERRTGIEGWFDTPTTVEVIAPAASPPPRWKQMVSIFLVFFPLSLIANWGLSPITHDWPLVLRVLLTVVLVTPVMTYLAMPLVTRALRPWLNAPKRNAGAK
jgi:antibiotic biosynthesis monooxygenase (ABM) superfamily enzyme